MWHLSFEFRVHTGTSAVYRAADPVNRARVDSLKTSA
jgi:hypothetical protein